MNETSLISSYADFLESLNKDNVRDLRRHVSPDVFFSDPFNKVLGADKMLHIFEDMYATLGDVHFEILHQATEDQTGFLHWRLSATLRGRPWEVEGVSHLTFNTAGKVVSHIDHWDAARDFYEHFPVVGWILRAIRKNLTVKV
ncbi:MAG: nuclear transport factor 2 family protein [Parvibaculum sp.]|nr:nuclear transport factor 2 family protein [Parvibaculum sp.]